ncbi:MAG: flippase [Gammaproteobacteria bacterium]
MKAAPWLNSFFRGEGIGAVVARKAGGSFLVKGAGQGLMFVLMILLARLMGADQFGVYVVVIAWLNILTLVSKFGLDLVVVRFVSTYLTQEQWGTLRGVIIWSNRVTVQLSLVIGLLAALCVWFVGRETQLDLVRAFWLAMIALPLASLASLRHAALQGMTHVVLAEVPEMIARPILIAAVVIPVVVIGGMHPAAPFVAGAHLFAVAASFALGAYWLNSRLPAKAKAAKPQYCKQEWMSAAFPLLLVSGTYMIISQTDTVMIGMLLDNTRAGYYNAASRLSSVIQFGFIAILAIAAPLIASSYAAGRSTELQRVLTLTAAGATAFAIPAAIILVILRGPLLGLFGTEFTVAAPALLILSIGHVFNAATGATGYLMTMTGRERTLAWILGVAVFANIAMNLWLIPWIGINGAAVSSSVAMVLWNTALVVYAWKRMGFNVTVLKFGSELR